jgi:MarR family 2-MHQ and catechol resistance regulon transcriptional repressor
MPQSGNSVANAASAMSSAYELDGFPAASLAFQRALEANRHRIAESEGLSGMELRAFFRIASKSGITPKELAVRLSVTNGAVTGISDRLVTAALIRRVEHPNDRRSIQLELTELGVDVMDRIHDQFLQMIAEATTTTSPSDLETTTATLRRITEQINLALSLDAPE